MIGGLIVMTFFGSSSTRRSDFRGAVRRLMQPRQLRQPERQAAGGGSTGAGGGTVSPGFATSFEIGGKNVVLTFGVAVCGSSAFGLSISETDSILLTDLGVSSVVLGAARSAVILSGRSFLLCRRCRRGPVFRRPLLSIPLALGGVCFVRNSLRRFARSRAALRAGDFVVLFVAILFLKISAHGPELLSGEP